MNKIALSALALHIGLASKIWATTYTVTPITAPAEGYQIIESSLKLDDLGQVIGNTESPTGNWTYFEEYGDITVLGRPLPNGWSQMFSNVSNHGILAGSTGTGDQITGFTQGGSTPTILPGIAKEMLSALAVNDSGQAVGAAAYPATASFGTAIIWLKGKATPLGVKVGNAAQSSGANAINNAGEVAGTVMQNSTFFTTVFTWQNGKSTILPTLGGSSQDYDINSSGAVIGGSADKTGVRHAVEWSGGKIIQLVSSTGYSDSVAVAINDSGEVLGDDTSTSGVSDAFVYQSGKATSVDSLFPKSAGYDFLQALDLNNAGQILAIARYKGQVEDVLLSPISSNNPTANIVAEIATSVPEPGVGLICSAFAFVGLSRRRVCAHRLPASFWGSAPNPASKTSRANGGKTPGFMGKSA